MPASCRISAIICCANKWSGRGFVQRMGRTGRRENTKRNCLFLALDDSELLLSLGISRLWREGRLERVVPALATDGGAPTCTTRSKSPTSMPSSKVDVATMTQSGSVAKAASA
jgi:hypothetical protein